MKTITLFLFATLLCNICNGVVMDKSHQASSPPNEQPKDFSLSLIAETPADLADVWHTSELNPQGQGCYGTWIRRPGTNVFDASWHCVGGTVTDIVEIRSIEGNEVVVYRTSERANYRLQLSDDKTRIVSGLIPWAPGWTITGSLGGSAEEDTPKFNQTNSSVLDFNGKWYIGPDQERILELKESRGLFSGKLFLIDHNNVAVPVYDVLINKSKGTIRFKAEIPPGRIGKYVESYNGKWNATNKRLEFTANRSYIPTDTYNWWAVKKR